MAKRLVLVRHTRTAAGHAGRLVGSTDVPLDAVGERQAARLASRAQRWLPQQFFCSPMQRCRQTAAAIFPDRQVAIDNDLREIDFGDCEDRTFAEIAQADPSIVERWAALEPSFALPGGESVGEFVSRVHGAADRLVRHSVDTLLVVSHGGVIRAMLCHLLGLDMRRYLAFNVGYGAIAVVDLFDGKGVLTALENLDVPESENG